eukprot:m.337964 g.337964  ORF g.337964 m.337964 type:complete len:247 (+) comp18277_c0_seq1:217-957(+)
MPRDRDEQREQSGCTLFLALVVAIVLINPANIKPPSPDLNDPSLQDSSTKYVIDDDDMLMRNWNQSCTGFTCYNYHPRPTSKPPSKNNLNDRPDMITSDGRNNGAAVFIAFFVLMLIQVFAVCLAVAVRRRAMQRQNQAMLDGIVVHRTRGGWLALHDDSDSDADEAPENTVGLPSYAEVAQQDGPPSYETAVNATTGLPPPPIDSNTTSDATPSVAPQEADTVTIESLQESSSNNNTGNNHESQT